MSDQPARIEDVLYDIPVEYRDRFADLVEGEPVPFADLRRDVETYIRTVKQVGIMVKLLDMDTATALANTAMTLLDAVKPDDPPEVRKLVQAAVQYFIVEEEDEEITGVLGFDDDQQVFNAVSRALGRADLVLRLRSTN